MTSKDAEPNKSTSKKAGEQPEEPLRSPLWLMVVIVGLFVALIAWGVVDR